MWLMYPIAPADITHARRGILALLAASAVWYLAVALVLAVWTNDILIKVKNKFAEIDEGPKNWTPFLILLVAFTAAGGLRALGYRLTRNVAGAMAVPESVSLSMLGAVVWLGACGTITIGFTGLLALVTALGTAFELKFLRYPATLFGLVVSPRAVTRVHSYFYARTAWLAVVVVAALILLLSHAVNDIPRNPGGPYEVTILRVTGTLKVAFNAAAVAAVVTLPIVTALYWRLLLNVRSNVARLLDPNGPVPQPEPRPRPGFDQLKSVLQPQSW